MEGFIEGEVIVVPFPNSDLSGQKRRPALIIKSLVGNDVMLCQITSKKRHDCYSVELDTDDFEDGNLNEVSVIRPNRLFTADVKLILYKIGKLNNLKIKEVQNILKAINFNTFVNCLCIYKSN